MTLPRYPLLLAALLLIAPAALAQTSDADTQGHEQTLKAARVAIDGPGLIEFLKQHSLSDRDRTQLKDKVKLLGDRAFTTREKATRELRAAGKAALPPLRAALRDPDLEVRSRATRLVEEIEGNSIAPQLIAALHLLSIRQPKGAVEAVLGFLPSAADEAVIDTAHTTLTALGVRNGTVDAALTSALADQEPSRRAAAAAAHARATTETTKKALTPLLEDKEPTVRYHAARALLQAGEPSAMFTLIALLIDGTPEQASSVEDMLFALAGDKAPPVTIYGTAEQRRKAQKDWADWWRVNGKTADLKKLQDHEPLLGTNLVCEPFVPGGGGRVFECDNQGLKKWELKCGTPLDAQVLPGGRVLIADHNGFVQELDRDGKEHWRFKIPSPVSVQRLANGNTFIASYNKICEVTRDGKELYAINRPSYVFYAQKLRNGRIVAVQSTNQVVELDQQGKELLTVSVPTTSNWGCVQVLPSGNFVVACSSSNQVVEVDRTGKVVWKVAVNNPMSGRRLRNGNVLVASHDDRKVYEFDASGKALWSVTVQGYPFQAHRR